MHMVHSAKMIHIPGPPSQRIFSPTLYLTEDHHGNLFLPWLLPVIVPPISRRGLGLHASILDREHIGEYTLLVHRHTEQLASIASTSAKFLTCVLHALVLAHHLGFLLAALLGPEQLPGAVDGPVTEVTVTGEAERARGERVVKEVANESYGLETLVYLPARMYLFGIYAESEHETLDSSLGFGAVDGSNILMRLSTPGPPFLLASALVVENDADCRAAVTGPGCCVWRFRVSWHTREIDGRTGAIDIGILNTLASDARAGDKDRIVLDISLLEGVGSAHLRSTGE
jgi:hypothetical protein